MQCIITFLAGSDADCVFHIVDKDFAVTDTTGVQSLAGGFHYCSNGHLCHDDINLNFRKQLYTNANATVILIRALLYAAAQNVVYGHTGYADFFHCVIKCFELTLTDNDFYPGQIVLGAVQALLFFFRATPQTNGLFHNKE